MGVSDLALATNLPFDILVSIFNFLLAFSHAQSTDVVSALRLLAACRYWHSVATVQPLWKQLRFSRYSSGGEDAVGQLIASDARILDSICKYCKFTQRIDCFFSRWSDALCLAVLRLVENCGENLQVLSFHSICGLDLPLSAIRLGDRCCSLKEFRFERGRCISMEDGPLLENLVGKWRSLQKLSLRNVPISTALLASAPQLLELSIAGDVVCCPPDALAALTSCHNLKRLSLTAVLHARRMTQMYETTLVEVLASCTMLEELSLERLFLGSALLTQISNKASKRLQVLRLKSCVWESFPQAVSCMQQLELCSCPSLSQDDFSQLCSAPQKLLHDLTLRNLHGQEVNDAILCQLACLFSQLRRLCITSNMHGGGEGISNVFLEALISGELLPNLQELRLRGLSRLSLAAISKVQLARPKVRVKCTLFAPHI